MPLGSGIPTGSSPTRFVARGVPKEDARKTAFQPPVGVVFGNAQPDLVLGAGVGLLVYFFSTLLAG